MSEPKFQGIWIPSEVLGLGLSTQAKIAYGIIAALDNEDGCYASNGYLGNVLSVSDRQVRAVITELEQAELIKRGILNGTRVIRTIEKEAIQGAVAKILGAEENFLPRRKKTSAGGGRKLPPYNIGNNIDDNKGLEYPFSWNDSLFKDFQDAWDTYTKHRQGMKRPMSKQSITSSFEQFKTWGIAKSIDALRASVRMGWVGVFEPKQNASKSQPLTSNDHTKF